MTTTRPLLPMASTGCACCTPTAGTLTPAAPGPKGTTAAPAPRGSDEPGAPAPAPAPAPETTYRVEGMSCGHCAGTVTAALEAVDGVRVVSIELVPGGASAVTVTGDRSVPADTIRTALQDAGYTLAPS